MDKYISNKIKNISLIMTFFVVILHSNNLEDPSVLNINTLIQNFIGQGIVRIAVPMFFLISGYLFFYKFKPSKEAFLNKYMIERSNLDVTLKDMSCTNDYVTIEY